MPDEKKVRMQLHKIIDEKRITPVYQPIVSLKDGEILGYEALSRIDMENCLFSTEEMFEYAELFRCSWNLEYLCRKKAIKGIKDEIRQKKLFINVDPYVLNDERFKCGMTKEYLERYDVTTDNIVFEISERTNIAEVEGFQRTINHYERQNYHIAIDDFCKGYAGFNRVYFLQPEYVKIDMSIIRDVDKDTVKSSLVAGFVKYCMDDNILLIAEGVETKEELEKLMELGVDYAQGYFLGKPKAKLQNISEKVKNIILSGNKNTVRKKSIPSIFANVGLICRKQGTTTLDTKAVNVFEFMQNNPEITELCVVDRDNNVCGMLTRQYIDTCFGGRFGYNLYSRKNVADIIDRNFLEVDIRLPIERVAKLALIRPRMMLYDAIVVSDNGKYMGIVTVKDLLEASVAIQVERAIDVNPLTHLPGNLQIQKQIESKIYSKRPFSIMYLDLDNFKAYNDAYGFENGDLMIQAVAECIKNACRRHEFMGHIGGDDFVIISQEYNLEDVFEKIVEDFCYCLKDLYSEEDYARKEINSKNRKGEPETFPLASISGALITNENVQILGIDDFSYKIALTKNASKENIGNTLQKYDNIA